MIEFSDRKLLEVYRGLEEAGLYSAGYKMGMFMAILTTAFRFAWQPFFLSEAKNPEAKQLFARIFTYFFLTAGFLFMLFMFYAPDILEWKLPLWNISILDPRYWPGMAVFPIILLAHLFDGIYSNFTVGVYLKNKTKVVPLIIGMGAVFNLGANFIVIPVHGMMGAAWTTLGAFIIMAVSLQLYIRRIYYIPYEWSRIFKLGLIIMVLSALYFFYPKFILWRLMLTVLFPILLLITGFFGKTELIRLKNLVSRGR
ncbi:MAG: polysaccharide biosynthesis C-terminal domain-containing protein [FCB group bacterium]|nr:polysaccharide biosynthesis C-terminal domain-containing protein [FCB group bacterium]